MKSFVVVVPDDKLRDMLISLPVGCHSKEVPDVETLARAVRPALVSYRRGKHADKAVAAEFLKALGMGSMTNT